MKVSASLDVNVVAHETTDEVAVLIDLEAPPNASEAPRPPAALQVVLDRSGSMSGAPLDGAKKALIGLVQRLDPQDCFGVVTFDDQAQVVVPAGPLADKAAVIRQIRADPPRRHHRSGRRLPPWAARAAESHGAETAGRPGRGTVLVISDGHINAGITDVDQFASLSSKAYADGVVTSTLGYGRGYDESLLAALARNGSGNHVFADNPDAAGAAIAQEVDGLLDKVVQAATLTVDFEPTVRMLKLYNDLPAHPDRRRRGDDRAR